MVWIKPKYSHGKVDRAGKALLRSVLWNDQRDEMLDVINNWRSVHSYPLHVITRTLKLRAKRVESECIVARRLKRLSSIKNKLGLQPTMQLTQMQDVGGCRAIMASVKHVKTLLEVYKRSQQKNPHGGRPQLCEVYDYLEKPKVDGYRSVHLVYKYQSKSQQMAGFNGRRIEIQIRSLMQHWWATTVELVDMVTGQALKSNLGSPQWQRFFSLTSGILADIEGCPRPPGLPDDPEKLIEETRLLVDQLQVNNVLVTIGGSALSISTGEARGWLAKALKPNDGFTNLIKEAAKSDLFLLALNPATSELKITCYPQTSAKAATDRYLELERESPELQTVLVSVDSVRNLEKAYPSYYLDTSGFLLLLRLALGRATEDDMKYLKKVIGSPSAKPSS